MYFKTLYIVLIIVLVNLILYFFWLISHFKNCLFVNILVFFHFIFSFWLLLDFFQLLYDFSVSCGRLQFLSVLWACLSGAFLPLWEYDWFLILFFSLVVLQRIWLQYCSDVIFIWNGTHIFVVWTFYFNSLPSNFSSALEGSLGQLPSRVHVVQKAPAPFQTHVGFLASPALRVATAFPVWPQASPLCFLVSVGWVEFLLLWSVLTPHFFPLRRVTPTEDMGPCA